MRKIFYWLGVAALCVGVFCTVLFSSRAAYAGNYVDTWLQNSSTTAPGTFAGTSRGYVNGGEFNARWSHKKEHLVSLTPPRFNVGCGGIDLSLGGFSHLNMDKLGQKMQNVMMQAPSYLLAMAIDAYCPECANLMKEMAAFADKFNQMQLDECHILEGIPTYAKDPAKLGADLNDTFAALSTLTDITSNTFSDYAESMEQTEAAGGVPNRPASEYGSGCPANVRDIFFTPNVSLLKVIATKRGYTAQELGYLDVLRGMIGDVYAEANPAVPGDFTYVYIPPCEGNGSDLVSGFLEGDVWERASGPTAVCSQITDVNKNLRQYVQTQLLSVTDKATSFTPYTASEKSFATSLPISLVGVMAAGGENNEIRQVALNNSDVFARAYAYGMVKDMHSLLAANIATARRIASEGAVATALTNGTPEASCSAKIINAGIASMQDLEERSFKLLQLTEMSYLNSGERMVMMSQIANALTQQRSSTNQVRRGHE